MLQNSIISRSIRVLSKSDRKKIFSVVVIQVLFGLLDLVGVGLVGILGALAITGAQSREPGNRVTAALEILNLENQDLQTQAAVVGLLAATLLILKTLLSVIFVRKTIFFLSRRSANISANLISRVLSQPLIKVQSKSMQQTLYEVTTGVESVIVGVLNTTVLIISDVSLLVILVIGLFFVDSVVAVSTLVVFSSIGFLLFRLLQVRATRLGEQQRILSIESSERTLEVLNSYREIVVRNRRTFYAIELGNIRKNLAEVEAERNFMPNISKYVIEITLVLGSLAIAALQFLVNDAARAVAVLAVFTAASTRIAPAVLRLQQGAINIKSNVGSATPTLDLIEDFVHLKSEKLVVKPLDFSHADFRAEISLENVSLRYPKKEKPAVDSISLTIQPGEVVAFVGPSGAGKTTIIDILLGVLEPDTGVASVQGLKPLEAIQKWPGAVGYVPQDVMISNGTVRENVSLGFSKDEFEDNDVWKALEVAQLSQFVQSLPNQLETRVGDRGAQLSGGQRQRLGIARAMFTRPKLLVLDEATSSLDGSTEAGITEAVHNLKGGMTIIMIAHRLSTVKESDRIFYISNGKILKSGTFDEVRQAIPEFDRQAQLMGL
jgi:ABC-type multidrug transport system fused ATPase/permease subunit